MSLNIAPTYDNLPEVSFLKYIEIYSHINVQGQFSQLKVRLLWDILEYD